MQGLAEGFHASLHNQQLFCLNKFRKMEAGSDPERKKVKTEFRNEFKLYRRFPENET